MCHLLYRLKRNMNGHDNGRDTMNPKKKPNYNPQEILHDLCSEAANLYSENKSLREIADELGLNPIKVRKLLITTGVYKSELAEEIREYYNEGKTIKEIMQLTKLSVASVNSYLPYSKVPYKAEECSVLADRIRLYRERKKAVEELDERRTEEALWNCIGLFAGYLFKTTKNLKFTYTVKGNEIFVTRKDKSVTKSTVLLAYQKVLELGGDVKGPKMLGVFGASYLYSVFVRFGVVIHPS